MADNSSNNLVLPISLGTAGLITYGALQSQKISNALHLRKKLTAEEYSKNMDQFDKDTAKVGLTGDAEVDTFKRMVANPSEFSEAAETATGTSSSSITNALTESELKKACEEIVDPHYLGEQNRTLLDLTGGLEYREFDKQILTPGLENYETLSKAYKQQSSFETAARNYANTVRTKYGQVFGYTAANDVPKSGSLSELRRLTGIADLDFEIEGIPAAHEFLAPGNHVPAGNATISAQANIDRILGTVRTDAARLEVITPEIETHWGRLTALAQAGDDPTPVIRELQKLVNERMTIEGRLNAHPGRQRNIGTAEIAAMNAHKEFATKQAKFNEAQRAVTALDDAGVSPDTASYKQRAAKLAEATGELEIARDAANDSISIFQAMSGNDPVGELQTLRTAAEERLTQRTGAVVRAQEELRTANRELSVNKAISKAHKQLNGNMNGIVKDTTFSEYVMAELKAQEKVIGETASKAAEATKGFGTKLCEQFAKFADRMPKGEHNPFAIAATALVSLGGSYVLLKGLFGGNQTSAQA